MNEVLNDKITIETRVAGGAVILLLLLAFLALYIESDHTDQYFSWTILPRTSAILIGAGYMAGAYFFARVISEKKWHRVQTGFLAITAFTIYMLAATLLHWSRFHQGTFVFYLWTATYAVTPLLVPFVWWRNRSSDPHTLEDNDFRFSSLIRWALGVVAVIGMLLGLLLFFKPTLLISAAPWKLTELTARIFTGWAFLAFSTALTIARDGRWSATRILFQSAMVGQALSLFALPRMWNDLDPAKPMTYAFVGGLVLALPAFIIIHLWLDRKIRRK
jgi:hypothetical protein